MVTKWLSGVATWNLSNTQLEDEGRGDRALSPFSSLDDIAQRGDSGIYGV
jgi:hypothetical protein